jgi:hypothetical protein
MHQNSFDVPFFYRMCFHDPTKIKRSNYNRLFKKNDCSNCNHCIKIHLLLSSLFGNKQSRIKDQQSRHLVCINTLCSITAQLLFRVERQKKIRKRANFVVK